MNRNTGTTDRIIRIIIGAAICIAGIVYKNWWGLIGLIPLLTAAAGYCPLYTLFGISTCKNRKPGA